MLERNPGAGLSTPYDWVAFGFSGYTFYDAHVGVVMDTSTWPCTCRVGFHRRPHLPEETHRRIKAVDWATAVGLQYERELIEATQEHQIRDRARPLDFADVAGVITHFASRAAFYYRAAAPALAVDPT